jgi:HSP20 family protein
MAIGYRYDRWDPFSEFDRLQGEINSLFSRVSPAPLRAAGGPPLRLYGNAEELVLVTEAPGLSPEDVAVSVIGNTLTLSVKPKPEQAPEGTVVYRRERAHRNATRTLELPHRVDADKVQAQMKNGMLIMRMPRAAADRPRQINVKLG